MPQFLIFSHFFNFFYVSLFLTKNHISEYVYDCNAEMLCLAEYIGDGICNDGGGDYSVCDLTCYADESPDCAGNKLVKE